MTRRLEDRVAIVTGAANGIGRAIAGVFAEHGAWVLVTDLDDDGAKAVAKEIVAAGGRADSCRVDIGNAAEIERAAKLALDRFGRVDVLMNNAAFIGQWHDVLNATEEEWSGCLNATILGTYRFTRAVLPSMIARRRGSIILTSSIMGMVGFTDSTSYSTVKAGLFGFARNAARDYGKHNVRVNVIAPGAINVRYSPRKGEPLHSYYVENTMLRRVGQPREVAMTALFLASDESSYITGAVLPVDGGWTAM